ncbi:MAG: extracellular solute-binding protein [Spirochaetales bacterium]|nr:extracellular solute-binding protein [Spirochaetales bacterium]
MKGVRHFLLFLTIFLVVISCVKVDRTGASGKLDGEGELEVAETILPTDINTVVIAASEFEPYLGEKLQNNGYIYEMVREIFEEAGYKVDFRYEEQRRALGLCEKGGVDMVLPLYYDRDLAGRLKFSVPFPAGFLGMLKQKDESFSYEGQTGMDAIFRSLSDYSIGYRAGATTTEVFDRADYLTKYPGKTDVHSLRMLGSGRIDLLLIDKYTGSHLMSTQLPHLIGKLEFMEPPLERKEFYGAFSPVSTGAEEKRAAFNEGYARLLESGRLAEILAGHGLYDLLEGEPIGAGKTRITIGSVDNGDMAVMEKLVGEYQKQNPHVEFVWRFMDESVLRDRLLSDLALNDGKFDVMTIGAFEAPIWAQRGWLMALENFEKTYQPEDLIPSIRKALSYEDSLYALPFYAESSMLYYRTDLFEQAGIEMPENPSWEEVARFAKEIHDPEKGIYGICLRGKPGWGENMSLLTTIVNGYGGRWFDEKWKPEINSAPWNEAVSFYTELLQEYGPPNPHEKGFSESLNLFANGQAGMWVDATVAAGMLYNRDISRVYDRVGFAAAPSGVRDAGKSWVWTWALAVPLSSKNREEAFKFIQWATSREYIELVGETQGWVSAPPGTRLSTYENSNYQREAVFADFVLKSIQNSDPSPTQEKPYPGIQFVGIPEFTAIAGQVAFNIEKILKGELDVQSGLTQSQELVEEQMIASGYIDVQGE